MKKKSSTFSRNLKFLRRLHGLTQNGLAEKLAIKRNKISSYESGFAEPNLSLLCQIGELFNISLEELVTGNMDENQNRINIRPFDVNATVGDSLVLDLNKFIIDTSNAQKFLDGLRTFQSLNAVPQSQHIDEKYMITLEHILNNNWRLIHELKDEEE